MQKACLTPDGRLVQVSEVSALTQQPLPPAFWAVRKSRPGSPLCVFQPNETWINSLVDNCTEYHCQAEHGVPMLIPRPSPCPDVSSCMVCAPGDLASLVASGLALAAPPTLCPGNPAQAAFWRPSPPTGPAPMSWPHPQPSLCPPLQGILRKTGCCYVCEEVGKSGCLCPCPPAPSDLCPWAPALTPGREQLVWVLRDPHLCLSSAQTPARSASTGRCWSTRAARPPSTSPSARAPAQECPSECPQPSRLRPRGTPTCKQRACPSTHHLPGPLWPWPGLAALSWVRRAQEERGPRGAPLHIRWHKPGASDPQSQAWTRLAETDAASRRLAPCPPGGGQTQGPPRARLGAELRVEPRPERRGAGSRAGSWRGLWGQQV